jgi:MFS family permease
MIFLCFLATTINYVDRATLAVAAPFMREDLHIDPAMMGVLLGGFFWTYAVMQLPAGWLIDRIGPRITYGLAVAWWSVFTMATAAARGAGGVMASRLLLGAGEAGCYPANAKVASLWFPRRERGLASGIFDSGSRVGAVLSLPIVTWLVGSFGWREAFVVTGAIGVIWVGLWFWLYRDPDKHSAVSPEQLRALRAEQPSAVVDDTSATVSWASLFRYRTIWGMMLGFFCLNFVIYFFITWFPTYLVQARGFSLSQLGTLGMLPGLLSIPAGWFGGWLSDRLLSRGWSPTAARKTCLVGGMLMSSVITLSAFASSAGMALVLFTIAYGSLAFTAANIWSLPADVAPSPAHVASIGGIQNFASNLAGISTATFTGVMVSITHGSYVVPLVVSGVFCILGAATYLFVVGRIEPLPPLDAGSATRRSGQPILGK